MAITIELPQDLEAALRDGFGDLASAGKIAMLIEFYRQGKISHGRLAECLGITRSQTDGLLREHHVTEDLLTDEELSAQLAGLHEQLTK